jgi:hypothetical protein
LGIWSSANTVRVTGFSTKPATKTCSFEGDFTAKKKPWFFRKNRKRRKRKPEITEQEELLHLELIAKRQSMQALYRLRFAPDHSEDYIV